MFLSWWRGLVQVANPKTKTSKDGNRWRIPRKFRYAARVEQLEDRVVPATNIFVDVGAATLIVQAMPGSLSPATADAGNATIQVAAATGTTTTVSTSNATPVYGTPVTLTATVTPASGTVVPTQGSVQFFDGTTLLGSGTFSNPQDANHDALFTYVTTATQLQVGSG
ncbi:MAG TPA: Ig-like domain-containing protein, partial [Gemmataceae bacterium]|nr:Ig-like domain-containing protein [Gemmataceae bacterium]